MTNQLDDDATEVMNEGRGLCRVLAVGVLLAVATVAGCVFTGCALLDTVASDERVQAEFDRAVERIRIALDKIEDAEDAPAEPTEPGAVPPLERATLASCWQGSNAQTRHMNMLSPAMPEAEFDRRLAWAKAQGCNTVHWFTSNHGDGEFSGYAPSAAMRGRIDKARRNGLAVVLWIFADDSTGYNKAEARDFGAHVRKVKDAGLFDEATAVVAGLELDEYFSASQVAALVSAIRAEFPGPVGTHETSGRHAFAGVADFVCYQVDPGKSADWIEAEARRVKAKVGKPLMFFELDRKPNRSLCEAALAGGAFAVGNWEGGAVATPQGGSGGDAVAYSALNWDKGGFDGRKATRNEGVEIGSLNVGRDGMSYRWVKGGCEQLGAGSKSDYSKTLACIFYRDKAGRWTGGKFDWISTSRTTRDFKNTHSGYNGWNAAEFDAATEFAFVIVGTGGRRSNVIRGARK